MCSTSPSTTSIISSAPYPISHGDFASADEVIEFVRRDITKFRNAMQSHNFPKFLETAHAMVRFTHAVELMFLERNIPEEDMDAVRRSIENSLDQVREIYGRTPKIEKIDKK